MPRFKHMRSFSKELKCHLKDNEPATHGSCCEFLYPQLKELLDSNVTAVLV